MRLEQFVKCGRLLLITVVLTSITSSAEPQSSRRNLDGMWSDPPSTVMGALCAAWCTDAGMEHLYALLDNPANDPRPFDTLQAEAETYQREKYLRPRLTADALKTYPLDPADDPGFLRCEPWGLARQIFSRHQLEIRQRGNDRIELRYGEWDAKRTVYLDGRARPANQAPSVMGFSVGHWEGEALVIETTGIRANLTSWRSEHGDRLRVIERYTRSKDAGTLELTATMEDPSSLREPLVIKKSWRWAPEQKITPYENCERPTEVKKGVR